MMVGGWLVEQRDRASPVTCARVTLPQYALHQQRDRASPVAWVGKTPLRPLARPQDRSGSPTK
ncbi:MAG: hypothetical protein ACHBN1_12765, partial [Heteroscytonema crispum UTEX LB 1556]